MMPAQSRSLNMTDDSELYLLGMKEILNLDSNLVEGDAISSIIRSLKDSKEVISELPVCDQKGSTGPCEVFTDYEDGVKLIRYSELKSSCGDKSSDISISGTTQNKIFSDSTLNCIPLFQSNKFCKKNLKELKSCSTEELLVLLEKLNRTTEEVSSELVHLLLENDALQQESDARNVAIEQLLKLTVKNSESELKPIQMSIVLPSDESDAI